MSDFIKGIIFKAPHENAPDFVKGKMSIKKSELIEFLQADRSGSDWLNYDLKVSKDGKWYFQLDTYKKDNSAPPR